MTFARTHAVEIVVLVTPHFNLAATLAYLDPFRAANYLAGKARFTWVLVSQTGGEITASNGVVLSTVALAEVSDTSPTIVVVSSSWSPERYHETAVLRQLQVWASAHVKIGALDTGGFMLAKAQLLNGKRATVHYEHIDAFIELYPDIQVTETLFEVEGDIFTCAGGIASMDVALHTLREMSGQSLANAVARYLFHHNVRGSDASQNPAHLEPFGQTTPNIVRHAIDLMEIHLESPLPIPVICERLNISQRQLGRVFTKYVRKTPVMYYRDIRLDRARGLVTQTEMAMSEVAVASGFSSQVHFSRAYRKRFGLSPRQDRVDGRVPFEFRAWPMHNPTGS